MDAGELEADIAFKAGADLVTVLGAADDSTIAGAVKAAKAHNKGIVVDLIGVADKVTRAKEVRALGAKFVEMHAGLDEQAKPGFDLNGLLSAGEEARVPFSVAGGVNLPPSTPSSAPAPTSPSPAAPSTAQPTPRWPPRNSAPPSSNTANRPAGRTPKGFGPPLLRHWRAPQRAIPADPVLGSVNEN